MTHPFNSLVALPVLVMALAAGCSNDREARDTSVVTTQDVIADDEFDALFTVDCVMSHRANDDPIVMPGRFGSSHSHDFFGSLATDANSDGEDLQDTATSCEDTADTASYWVPTLSRDGVPLDARVLRAYYRAPPGSDVTRISSPPVGMKMLAGYPGRGIDGRIEAGDEHHVSPPAEAEHAEHGDTGRAEVVEETTETPSGVEVAGWGCGLNPKRFRIAPPEGCTGSSELTLRLLFPDCWNGRDLDSDDHRSHVAYSIAGRCPERYPVHLFQLQVSVQWPVTGAQVRRVTISSGPVSGAHGDFLNGWKPEALDAMVTLCIHANANCTNG